MRYHALGRQRLMNPQSVRYTFVLAQFGAKKYVILNPKTLPRL
jgi:hypothetical protein